MDEVDAGREMRAPAASQRSRPGSQLPVRRTRSLIPNPQHPSQFSIWHLFLIYLSSPYSLHQRKIAFINSTILHFHNSIGKGCSLELVMRYVQRRQVEPSLEKRELLDRKSTRLNSSH